MFSKAIVRAPCESLARGLTTVRLGPPDIELARVQHRQYVRALEECGLDVLVLDEDDAYPDSTFVEDLAIPLPSCAIITNPGANSRKGETLAVREILGSVYSKFEQIREPGTLDGGDVMKVGRHYYIGLSQRTNHAGADQLTGILQRYGLNSSKVRVNRFLHLKSGAAYLENDNLLAAGEFLGEEQFQKYNILAIPSEETYAANCVWVNGKVLVAKGFPKTCRRIKERGYDTIEIDTSEFQKMDGGLSCLSIRF